MILMEKKSFDGKRLPNIAGCVFNTLSVFTYCPRGQGAVIDRVVTWRAHYYDPYFENLVEVYFFSMCEPSINGHSGYCSLVERNQEVVGSNTTWR